MTLNAQQLASILGTNVAAGESSVVASAGVSTDTRNLPSGCIFIALKGENYDANDFALQALEKGASIAIVSRWEYPTPAHAAVIVVSDPLLALQALATWWRAQLHEILIIALTGSNGKTSTKDITRSIFAEAFPVHATRGNLNNHIGLPLTILETTTAHRAAVYEMGMNHAGEIAPLAAIAKPHCAIITNVGTAHIEFLGSRENIAREKAAVASTLRADQPLFVPHDCDFLDIIRSEVAATIITTGGPNDSIRATEISATADGMNFMLHIHGETFPVMLPVAGHHMVANALLATAAAHHAGLSNEMIARGLSRVTLTSGRLRRFVSNDVIVIDDTYNANPESMIAGIHTLASMPIAEGARRIAVLGQMGEQGTFLADGCRRVGETASQLGIHVIAIGPDAYAIHQAALDSEYFPDQESAAAALTDRFQPHDAVLFKGSRTARMERLMKKLFPETTCSTGSI